MVYKEDNKIDFEELKTYLDAELHPKSKLLQDFYRLEEDNKKKINDDK
ncbi:hypothetical protein [Flavobacterium columnare]|nr:hypothetical protein [Flavobacterium columnare]